MLVPCCWWPVSTAVEEKKKKWMLARDEILNHHYVKLEFQSQTCAIFQRSGWDATVGSSVQCCVVKAESLLILVPFTASALSLEENQTWNFMQRLLSIVVFVTYAAQPDSKECELSGLSAQTRGRDTQLPSSIFLLGQREKKREGGDGTLPDTWRHLLTVHYTM